MKRTMIILIAMTIILALASCSANPQEKIVGKWIINPESENQDLPIEITAEKKAVIMDQAMDITFGEENNGVLEGQISVPMGMSIDFKYTMKTDVILIEAMGNASEYVRFSGTEEEWEEYKSEAIRRQTLMINMYFVDMSIKKFYEDNSNAKEITLVGLEKYLPPTMSNAYDPSKKAIEIGYDDVEFTAEKTGMIYIKLTKGSKEYEIKAYGRDSFVEGLKQ